MSIGNSKLFYLYFGVALLSRNGAGCGYHWGLVSVTNLNVSVAASLTDRYGHTVLPSQEVRVALITHHCSLGISLEVLLYLFYNDSVTCDTSVAPASFMLMATFVADLVASVAYATCTGSLAEACLCHQCSTAHQRHCSVHGEACNEKGTYTCNLHTTALALQWTMSKENLHE